MSEIEISIIGAEELSEEMAVRRQRFWDNRRPDLVEALAHQGFHFKRLPCDAASAVG